MVVADSDDCTLKPACGSEGTVLGMGLDEESNRWRYAVLIALTGDVWDLGEEQLLPTGKHLDREDVYSNDVLRVKCNPKTGERSVQ